MDNTLDPNDRPNKNGHVMYCDSHPQMLLGSSNGLLYGEWGLALGGTVLFFFSLPETRQTDFPTMVNHSEKPSVAVEEL